MNGTKTISGTLDIGLEVDGQLHRDFTLRLPTVGDEIDVADDESVPDSGYRVALMGRCMVTLGTLTPEKITFELLRQELNSDDFLQLVRAADELKKKRKAASESSTGSVAPASALAQVDTQKPTSAPLVL
ncbi:hypothetical protein PRCB_03090 [Pantoea rodasii]|uniref:Phage tail assembly protein n=1 Tax=Pantoea rodasii TaxID=1076549 RepID=A0A2M9WHJ3_9GAMM|nr:phage tail assembly protein [Pantoea rodasii]PJZ07013.1 hypothetical protein PRCB_03090 [Pantoea rodasii]